jgi:hypothetical protein
MPLDTKADGNCASMTGDLAHDAQKKSLKERAIFEAKKYAIVAAYLWAFFAAFHLYRSVILEGDWRDYWGNGFALLNALIFGKVILIGDALNIGSGTKGPRIYFALVRAFLFAILIVAFHVVEDIIKGAVHGRALEEALTNFSGVHVRTDLAAVVIFFVTLIPFFAFDSIERGVGEGSLWEMLRSGSEKKFKLTIQE